MLHRGTNGISYGLLRATHSRNLQVFEYSLLRALRGRRPVCVFGERIQQTPGEGPACAVCLHRASVAPDHFYFSSINRQSIGQACAHLPQAMHLNAFSVAGSFLITCIGQTSTQVPQPVQSFLFTM